MMAEQGATMGTARDLRARVVLALISASPAKPSEGRAAALVREAQAVMAFITGEADAASAVETPLPTLGEP